VGIIVIPTEVEESLTVFVLTLIGNI